MTRSCDVDTTKSNLYDKECVVALWLLDVRLVYVYMAMYVQIFIDMMVYVVFVGYF
jgi:hypothetical protein